MRIEAGNGVGGGGKEAHRKATSEVGHLNIFFILFFSVNFNSQLIKLTCVVMEPVQNGHPEGKFC